MKKILFLGLVFTSISQLAMADLKSTVEEAKNSIDGNHGNALDGTWKWQKTYCGKKRLDPLKSLFQKSVITLNGSSGYITSDSKHPIGRVHKAEIEKVTYLSGDQLKLECSDQSKNDKETKEIRGELGRTYDYIHDGGMLDLRFEDKSRCETTLGDLYQLEK